MHLLHFDARRRERGARLVDSGLLCLTISAVGCGGHVDARRPAPSTDAGTDAGGASVGPTPTAKPDAGGAPHDAAPAREAAAPRSPDASVVVDASHDAAPKAASDSGGAPDAGTCPTMGALTIAGDYAAPDGTQYWFRRSITATTYTVVPKDFTTTPRLSRVVGYCPRWLSLAGTDGSFARLDWDGAGASLRICVRSAPSASALATLSAPDPNDGRAGCDAGPWLELSRLSP
ncbi:MAG TPA: hypothetical protein VHC69_30510 [Polyangiaceae bacterium]|nr:hypothetical protein [Polyangiaceae bacterium]